MEYFACFFIIGLFTVLPLIGVAIASQIWDLDTNGMFIANLIHVCIIIIGAICAINKVKKRRYGWDLNSSLAIRNVNYFFYKTLLYSIAFSVVVFLLYGRAIFSGEYRGDVRTSVGAFGWLVTFITIYAVPGLMSYATVVYFYYSDINSQSKIRSRYYLILGLGIFVGLMLGGKSSVVTMMFPPLIQYSQKLTIRKGIIIAIVGSLSIILIGERQMEQTFTESLNYNIYRSTDLAGFGTACVWDKYPDGAPHAYLSIYNALGENITSIITGVDRHSYDFLKYNVARDVTYDYYNDPDGAISGAGNLTVTSFGEAVFWFGHHLFFVVSVISGIITYKLLLLLFKSRHIKRMRYNTLVTVYFTSVYISWLNSTTGSLISAFLGLTTIFYMVLLYYLIKFLEQQSKIRIYVKNSFKREGTKCSC